MGWQPEHDALLRSCISQGQSFLQAAITINEEFGTDYSRNACISRARRKVPCAAPTHRTPRAKPVKSQKERNKITAVKRKEKRWAANPSLAERYEHLAVRAKERKALRDKFIERGTPKTSPVYRKHLPRQREMSKSELRAQLSIAVQNTANMGEMI